MKRWLLGSRLGTIGVRLRATWGVLVAAWRCPEFVGCYANDALASRLLVSLPLPGKTFVDVGAHIGSISSMVLQEQPGVKIEAVEAIPEKAAMLRRRFGERAVHDCALGETAGEVSFFINRKASGYSSLSGEQAGFDASSIREIRVPMKTLDDTVLADDVDVIKIDVEGAELGVIRGARRILALQRPTIMFESGPHEVLGYRKSDLFRELAAQRYAILLPNRVAHNDEGLSEAGFLEAHLYPQHTSNFFAVAIERRNEVRDRARCVLGIE